MVIPFKSGAFLFCTKTKLLFQFIFEFENQYYITKPNLCLERTQVTIEIDERPHSLSTFEMQEWKMSHFIPSISKFSILRLYDVMKFNEQVVELNMKNPEKTDAVLHKGIAFFDIFTRTSSSWNTLRREYEGQRIQFNHEHYNRSEFVQKLIDVLFLIYMTDVEYGNPNN